MQKTGYYTDSTQNNQLGVKHQTLYNGIPLLSTIIAKISYLKTLTEKITHRLSEPKGGLYGYL